MEELNLILGLSTVSIGISFIILDDFTTARVEQIGMNHYYNMRIRKAFESKENWHKINCFGVRQWIIFSVLMIHIGVISFFILFAQHHFLMTLLILLNYGLNRCIIAVSINRYGIYLCQTFLYLTLAVI